MAALSALQASLGDCGVYFTAFGVLGASYIGLKTVLGILRFLRDYFIGPILGLSANVKNAGQWAVITGCTDGIGKAYTEQLAKKGVNVVLISRTQAKLDDLAKELESKYKVQTKVIAADFTRTDIYDRLEQNLQGLDIGVLVNNVGVSYQYPQYFLELPDTLQCVSNMLNCNLISMVMMTKIILPSMLERRRGYIINIGSSAAESTVPMLTLYAASKQFMDNFTMSLSAEYANKGVTFQSVRPGFVATKMSGIRKANIFAPYPDKYVKSALATLGITNSTNGFWSHRLMNIAMSLLPSFIPRSIMKQTRAAAIKRLERKKAQ